MNFEDINKNHKRLSEYSPLDLILNKKAKRAPISNFLQKDLHRSLDRDDYYCVWRRYQNGIETWLCVIWHKNWDHGRQGSDAYAQSYLREDVEKWAIATLLRIHHPYDVCEIVHADFEKLASDPDF